MHIAIPREIKPAEALRGADLPWAPCWCPGAMPHG